jgi:hypothetical protein
LWLIFVVFLCCFRKMLYYCLKIKHGCLFFVYSHCIIYNNCVRMNLDISVTEVHA